MHAFKKSLMDHSRNARMCFWLITDRGITGPDQYDNTCCFLSLRIKVTCIIFSHPLWRISHPPGRSSRCVMTSASGMAWAGTGRRPRSAVGLRSHQLPMASACCPCSVVVFVTLQVLMPPSLKGIQEVWISFSSLGVSEERTVEIHFFSQWRQHGVRM